jgi:hypothetical protein
VLTAFLAIQIIILQLASGALLINAMCLFGSENMFQNIADNEEVRISFINNQFSFLTFSISKFDIIFWTGDISAHNIWSNTKEDAINEINTLSKLFKKYFPDKIVYSSLGNHDLSPTDL